MVDLFRGAGRYPGTVSFRPFWEMNLDVAAYSLNYAGPDRQVRDVDEWINTWRYLVDLQRRIGGPRVRWMFCANGSDVGDVPMEAYWPGRDYVDTVALDTYNGIWSGWTSFDGLVRPMYDRLVALAPGLPVAIGEVGSREATGPGEPGKADWVREMFRSTEFPALDQVLFFSARTTSDYRLDSSGEALAA
jgi:beta-mannanase